MTRTDVILQVWLPAYLAALGRGHDPIRARQVGAEAVHDFYHELERAVAIEQKLKGLT